MMQQPLNSLKNLRTTDLVDRFWILQQALFLSPYGFRVFRGCNTKLLFELPGEVMDR